MNAILLEELNQKLCIKEYPIPEISENELLIKIKAASLNHRDLWIQKGKYGGIKLPVILGADCSGVVVKTGTNVDINWQGKEVIVNPSLRWGNDARFQGNDYEIIGSAYNGTFAEYFKIPVTQVHLKPENLSFTQAAALPLAGVTAYRATISRANIKAGENVLITGAGGGVALHCIQFAVALGANVAVTSGSDEKIQKAISLGAKVGVNYSKADWEKELKKTFGLFDAIIDSSGGPTFEKIMDIAKPAARIVMYGATLGGIKCDVPAKIFWKQLNIMGSTMGNEKEFEEMIEFVNKNKIIPIVDEVFPLAEAQQAIERMEKGDQFGKIVLHIED